MVRIAVLVSGGGTNLEALLKAEEAGRIPSGRIELVVADRPSYALERAANHGRKAVLIERRKTGMKLFSSELIDVLCNHRIDMVILAGFLSILPPSVIDHYRDRIINIHPSLIPSFCGTGYYGLKVHEGVLARGVRVTGATCHFVDEGTDTGPIILQKAVEVKQGDTPEVLQRRVMEQAEWKIMPHAIDLIANGRVSVEDGHVIIDEK